MHLSMELFLAAPDSGLPSALLALSVQHFFMWLAFAAPASGLPSADMAVQAAPCARAGAAANMLKITRTDRRFMDRLPVCWNRTLAQPHDAAMAATRTGLPFSYAMARPCDLAARGGDAHLETVGDAAGPQIDGVGDIGVEDLAHGGLEQQQPAVEMRWRQR